jgi:multicomponent Na+:H+ antiporter subunit D
MSTGQPFALWAVASPLVAALLATLPGLRLLRAVVLAGIVTTLAASVALALQVQGLGPQRYELGAWGAPLGIDLTADGLAALLVLLTAAVMATASLHALAAPGSMTGEPGNRSHFWPVWLFLWASLNALLVSGDAFNLYVCLELLTLAAVVLTALSQKAEAMIAAMRYLLAALVGSLLYLLGVALLYGVVGVLDLGEIERRLEPGMTAQVAAALMTGGLLLKTALFPLHYWLPPAHANAASPVSAVLSGLVVKASFYLLVRLWLGPFAALFGDLPWQVLGALGAAAVLWGSLQAIQAPRLKLIVAYSTVAQLGYLFLLFPLLAAGARIAWQGVVLHLLAHALAKAAAFLAAGNVLQAIGHDRLEGVVALRTDLRMSLLAIALAGTSLMGLPPSGGFVAKWLLLEASLASGAWWWAVVIVVGSALAAVYVFRVLGAAMAREPGRRIEIRPVPARMEVLALLPALAATALGITAGPPLALLEIGGPSLVAGPT